VAGKQPKEMKQIASDTLDGAMPHVKGAIESLKGRELDSQSPEKTAILAIALAGFATPIGGTLK
jgi:hypothetical protein